MTRTNSHTNTKRAGFTLIELLVVIAIIAVLAGLGGAAIFRFAGAGRDLQVRNEISQMENALAAFKQKFDVYPPSRIKLGFRPISPWYGSTQLDTDSINFIRKVFPRCFGDASSGWLGTGILWKATWTGSNADWVILDGHECLVFFLLGVRASGGAADGFSTNPLNPMLATGTRIGPFFEFPSPATRLIDPNNNGFASFADPYGTQYAYFSSYNVRNGYNRYPVATNGSDCSVISNGAYFSAAGQYHNPNTFQIISAGSRLSGQTTPVFSNGSQLNAASGVTEAAGSGAPLSNDISNFSQKALGVPIS